MNVSLFFERSLFCSWPKILILPNQLNSYMKPTLSCVSLNLKLKEILEVLLVQRARDLKPLSLLLPACITRPQSQFRGSDSSSQGRSHRWGCWWCIPLHQHCLLNLSNNLNGPQRATEKHLWLWMQYSAGAATLIWFKIWGVVDPGPKQFNFSWQIAKKFWFSRHKFPKMAIF